MEPRNKEAATHCALLQEHAQRCYVRGEQGYHLRKECGSEGVTTGAIGLGTGQTITALTPVAHSTSIRAVPKLAASSERDLPGSADSRGCL